MEKNKLDSFARMTPKMREIADFEEREALRIQRDYGPDLTAPEAYALARQHWNEAAPVLERSEEHLLKAGDREIPFVIHYPNGVETPPVILFTHGGGFTVGSPKTHEGIMRRLVTATGAAVVGIDYSLAPDSKFPVALEECVALAEHLHQSGGTYGLARSPLSLAGDSAGAYLSLAAALWIRDHAIDCPVESLLLYYGAFGLEDSMSMRLYGGIWDGLTLKDLKSYSDLFTRAEDQADPYRKLFNNDLTHGIAPAYIMACELDPLKDDSRLLHAIMAEHGMVSIYREVPGVIHGFLHYSNQLPEAAAIIDESGTFYRRVHEDQLRQADQSELKSGSCSKG